MRNVNLDRFNLENFDNLLLHDNIIANDYLRKSDGTYRSNSYLISPYLICLLNLLSYEIYIKYGKSAHSFFSGDFSNFQFFYNDSYDQFQKSLLATYTEYDYFIKIDLKDFYKNIKLDYLSSFKINEMHKIIELIKYLGLDEFPILQDCAGLSYISTCIILNEMDKELSVFFERIFSRYEIFRYSDDLYVLYKNEVDYDLIKSNIIKIISSFGFEINESKYQNSTSNKLPEYVYQQLYNIFINDIQLDIHSLLGTDMQIIERINMFLINLNAISTFDEYNEQVEQSFSLVIGEDPNNSFKKNLFNEILYNKNISQFFSNEIILDTIKSININDKIHLDPRRLTLIILFCRNEGIIKRLLFNIYTKLESKAESNSDILSLLTYISQRNCSRKTLEKIKIKIKKSHENLSIYIEKYIDTF